MHATHTRQLPSRPALAVLSAALTLALTTGAESLFAEEPIASSLPAPQTAPAEPVPAPPGDTAISTALIFAPGAVETLESPPKMAGPESAALELTRVLPFRSRLNDVKLRSGMYVFAENDQGNLMGLHVDETLPMVQRVHLEDTFEQNPDLNRRSSFVGLWASIPLREGSRQYSQNALGSGPQRTLVASIGTEPTRHRNSRKAEVEIPGAGFLSRLRPNSGILDRSKSSPPALSPTPLTPRQEAQPSPVVSASPVAAPAATEKPARGLGLDFFKRLRR